MFWPAPLRVRIVDFVLQNEPPTAKEAGHEQLYQIRRLGRT